MTVSISSPFDLPGFEVDSMAIEGTTLHIVAHSTTRVSICPDCKEASSDVHSYYSRHPQDLPCLGLGVRWHLTVKRFRCNNPGCTRKTFVERMPDLVPVHGRRLLRLTGVLRSIGLDVGGEAAARVGQSFRIHVSGSTILRILRQTELAVCAIPQVLGVDDWAFARGQCYGTILVDLERHQPVDLLPDREATTLASWLQAHPGVEFVTRDRSSEYEAGITAGAPDAIQIADRWHLLKNLGEAVQRVLQSHSKALRQTVRRAHEQNLAALAMVQPEAVREEDSQEESSTQSYREQIFREVKALIEQGMSNRAIAGQLSIDRRTVARYRVADEVPVRNFGNQNVSQVTPYFSYLRQRLAEGCHNRAELWRELRDQGFTGSYMSVWRAMKKLDPEGTLSAPSTPSPFTKLSPRQAMWLLVRPPEKLDDKERQLRDALLECSAAAATVYPLAQRFVEMVTRRKADELDVWLADVYACDIPKLHSFAKGLQDDEACVRAALSYEWSNGQVEGQINRLKFIKRQGYGRAKFDLLRLRVLYSGP
jgi:transposase